MTTSKMIEYGGRTIPRRPGQFDKEVLDEVFDGLKPILVAYMETDEGDVESLRKYFLKILSTDGYDIAREMEMYARLGGSTELVEIFDNAPFGDILTKHIRSWVDYFKIEPLLKVGDKVRWRYIEGTIEEVSHKFVPGVYVINVPYIKRSRILAAWEDCELLETK